MTLVIERSKRRTNQPPTAPGPTEQLTTSLEPSITTHRGEQHFADDQGRVYLKISPSLQGSWPGMEIHDPNTGKPVVELLIGPFGHAWFAFQNSDGSDALRMGGGGEPTDQWLNGGSFSIYDGMGRMRIGMIGDRDAGVLEFCRRSEELAIVIDAHPFAWWHRIQRHYYRVRHALRDLVDRPCPNCRRKRR